MDAIHTITCTTKRFRSNTRTSLWKFDIFNVKLWVKTQHNFFSVIFNFVRVFPHISRMLEFSEINKKSWWADYSFRMDYERHVFGLKHFYCFRDSKYLSIILICAHMAWNPHFSAGSQMCLMGDIQSGSYYLLSGNVHLSKSSIRFSTHTFYETLDFHYIKNLHLYVKSYMQHCKT